MWKQIKREYLFLFLIVLLAGILRFYKLGSLPSFFNDEAAVGYNAYSLLKTGKDEFGKPWPLFFRSFGEGKLPIYVYQDLLPVAVFGLTEFAARFPAAFFGTLAVLMIYFFSKEVLCSIFPKPKQGLEPYLIKTIPLLSSLFLAVMPWAIHFSRGVFGQEGLFWMLLGSYFSLRTLRIKSFPAWLWGNIAFAIGLGTYHAAKAFVPLWLSILLINILLSTKNIKRVLILAICAFLISGSTWLITTLSPLGMARAADMSLLSPHSGVASKIWQTESESGGQPVLLTRILHNKVESYGRDVLERYFSHFSPDFLFFVGDPRILYRIPNVAQLLMVTLPLLGMGLFWLFRLKIWPVIVFLGIAPISAALTFETPSSVRAILMVAPLAFIIALGASMLLFYLHSVPKLMKYGLVSLASLLLLLNTYYYCDAYFLHAKYHTQEAPQYGNREAMQLLYTLAPQYDQIKVTEKLSSPYIFYLFYNHYDPAKWQPQSELTIEKDKTFQFIHIRKVDSIQFIDEGCPDRNNPQQGTLYVCLAGTQPGNVRVIKTVNDLLGKPELIFFEKEVNELKN